jgi:hypothetical protein
VPKDIDFLASLNFLKKFSLFASKLSFSINLYLKLG